MFKCSVTILHVVHHTFNHRNYSSIIINKNISLLRGDTKKNGHHQKSNNLKKLFRSTQNFSYSRSNLCSRHVQSFKSVLQEHSFSPLLKKCTSNEIRDSDGSNVAWCSHLFRSSTVWLSVSVFTVEVMHSPMGCELVDLLCTVPCVLNLLTIDGRKFTTCEPFFALQLSCEYVSRKCVPTIFFSLRNPLHLQS